MHDLAALLTNIVVGIVGALIAGFLLNRPTINQSVFNLNALVVSLIGTLVWGTQPGRVGRLSVAPRVRRRS